MRRARQLFTTISAAGFWVGLAALWWHNRQMGQALEQLRVELDADDIGSELQGEVAAADKRRTSSQYMWATPKGGQPMRVPKDMLKEAAKVLAEETPEQQAAMEAEQWEFTLTPNGLRMAMYIAQREPDIEVALFNFVGMMGSPKK